MQVQATYRMARISAFKAREVTREIQGLPVSAAIDVLAFSPKKAAGLVGKTLKSAVANAENNHELRPDRLVVKEAVVGEGPTVHRFSPRARGSASPIRKRTSHIKITLTDEIEIPEPRKKRAAKGGAKKQNPTKQNRARRKPAAAAPAAAAETAEAADAPKEQE